MTTTQSAAPRFGRLRQVMAMSGRGRSMIYHDMPQGKFPKSIKIGPRAVAWDLREIEEWMAARLAERDAKSAN